jgi:hypothetical protein
MGGESRYDLPLRITYRLFIAILKLFFKFFQLIFFTALVLEAIDKIPAFIPDVRFFN